MAMRSMPFWPRPATTSGSLWPGSGLCAPFSGRLSWSGMTRAAPPPHPPEHANSLFHRRRAIELHRAAALDLNASLTIELLGSIDHEIYSSDLAERWLRKDHLGR